MRTWRACPSRPGASAGRGSARPSRSCSAAPRRSRSRARARVDRQRLAVLAEPIDAVGVGLALDRLAVGRVERHLRRVEELVADLLLVARRSRPGRDAAAACTSGRSGGGAGVLRGHVGRRRHAREGAADRDDDIGVEPEVAHRRRQADRCGRVAERAAELLRRGVRARRWCSRRASRTGSSAAACPRRWCAASRPSAAAILACGRDALHAGAVDRHDAQLGRRDRLRALGLLLAGLLGAADQRCRRCGSRPACETAGFGFWNSATACGSPRA